jgi:hypothetical protein
MKQWERLREKRRLAIIQWKKDLAEMGFQSYADYLSSDLWASIKRAVMDRAKGKCRLCRKEAEVVHHRRYDRCVMEGKANCHLVALCRVCHHNVEVNHNGEKRSSRGAEIAYKRMMKRAEQGKPLVSTAAGRAWGKRMGLKYRARNRKRKLEAKQKKREEKQKQEEQQKKEKPCGNPRDPFTPL